MRYATFGKMLEADDPEQDRQPLLVGADHTGPLELTLADLRRTARRADQWCRQQGFAHGDSLLLVRRAHSSEVPLAAAVVALMSLGMRVVLPMSFDRTALGDIAEATGCRAMLWCAGDVETTSHAQVRGADVMFRAVADERGLATFSLDGELGWHLSTMADDSEPSRVTEYTIDPEREVLVLSTSGSTGRPKLVRYTEAALLRVAEAWNAAGLMSEALTGGRSLCPTLSHSMGLRNVLHAIWNRQPTVLAQPEWLEEQPKKFVKLLERCPPQHVTCGPALLADLGLLANNVRRIREALTSLRCVVSSGAADADIERVLPEGVRVANAFGMTEVQQVLNTLVGPPTEVRCALGRPLPGVTVAVRYVDAAKRIGRLFVASPFAAKGYVGAPDFGAWFDTGDLVRVEGDDLVWIGRADEDFLNTGLGIKVSMAELRSAYEQLQRETEAVLFVALPSRGGVGAVVYVSERNPAAEDVHHQLLEAVASDHQKMAEVQRQFALNYTAISVIGCVRGRPPKRGPGKIDREQALSEQAELLAAMDDPTTDHPQIVSVSQHGSDRPDWRRYTSGNS
jgi:acyl-coenzyme A synthetase/AMP-(fatty) acid ligase